MEDVGRDILGVLFKYLSPVDRNSFRGTCKVFYSCPKREVSSLVQACSLGYLNIIKEARRKCIKKTFFGDNLSNISVLVEHGRIVILEYLLSIGRKCPIICPFSVTDYVQRKIGWKSCSPDCKKKHIPLHSSLFDFSVIQGSRETIDWLRSYQVDSSHLDWAVIHTKHTHLLQLLLDQGLTLTKRHLEVALESGNTEMVKFLVYNECPASNLNLYNATCSGNLELVKYAYDIHEGDMEFCPVQNPYTSENVAKFLIDRGIVYVDLILQTGNLELIKYILQKGIILPHDACSILATTDYVEVMDYLKQLGCPWNSETIDIALNYERRKMFSYCLLEGCPISIYTLKNCAKLASREDLVLLERMYEFEFDDYTVRKCVRHDNVEALLYLRERGYSFSQNLMKTALVYSESETIILLHSFGLCLERLCSSPNEELIGLYLRDSICRREVTHLCFSRGLVEVIKKYPEIIRENVDLEVLVEMSNVFDYKFFKFFIQFFELGKDSSLTKFVVENGDYRKFKYLAKFGITNCMLETRTSPRIENWLNKHLLGDDIR